MRWRAGHALLHFERGEVGLAVERGELDRAFAAGRPALVNVLQDPTVVYPRKSNLA